MSRRKKQYRQMPGGSHFDPSRQDLQRELEIANSVAIMTTPKAQAILAKLAAATTNQERLEASLLLQELVRGDASILRSPALADNLNQMRATAVARDKAEVAFANNKEAFIEETIAKAEKNKLTGDRAERLKVWAAAQLKDAITKAKAKKSARHLQIDWQLEHEPKREIHVSGIWETIRVGDGMQNVLRPEVIRILHRTFVLKPGANVVPETVAKRYDQILQSRQEQEERKAALSSQARGGLGMEVGMLERTQRAIDDKYRVGREAASLT